MRVSWNFIKVNVSFWVLVSAGGGDLLSTIYLYIYIYIYIHLYTFILFFITQELRFIVEVVIPAGLNQDVTGRTAKFL